MPAAKKTKKTKANSKKKSAPKKAKSTARSRSKSSAKKRTAAKKAQPKGVLASYLASRDQFYRDNPNIQWLLSVMIFATVVYLVTVLHAYGYLKM